MNMKIFVTICLQFISVRLCVFICQDGVFFKTAFLWSTFHSQLVHRSCILAWSARHVSLPWERSPIGIKQHQPRLDADMGVSPGMHFQAFLLPLVQSRRWSRGVYIATVTTVFFSFFFARRSRNFARGGGKTLWVGDRSVSWIDGDGSQERAASPHLQETTSSTPGSEERLRFCEEVKGRSWATTSGPAEWHRKKSCMSCGCCITQRWVRVRKSWGGGDTCCCCSWSTVWTLLGDWIPIWCSERSAPRPLCASLVFLAVNAF